MLYTIVCELLMDNLPEEIKLNIIKQLKNHIDVASFIRTNKSNNKLLDTYPTNHPNFAKAYTESLKQVYMRKILLTKIDPTALLQKCNDLYEGMVVNFSLSKKTTILFFKKTTTVTYSLPNNIYQTVQIFNKAILIYLKMITKDMSNIYYLAKIVGLKSGLTDLYGIHGVKKYRVIEFELYKLYMLSYLLKPSALYKKKHLREVSNMILEYSKNGITGFVRKANASQIACATFMNYYLSNSAEALSDFINAYNNIASSNFIKIPITSDKKELLAECIVFMLTDKRAVSSFTKEACVLDLSLIDPPQDYKQLHLSTLQE